MKRFVTVSEGMAGHFAVMIWWNDEDPKLQFWEPFDTGLGRYRDVANAIDEAKEWALAEGCRYVGPGEKYDFD